jgi:protein-tyrosine phosphatase
MFDQIYLYEAAGERYSEAKKRYLDFSGTKNFRDLGGYRTVDGRTVRWETLYRSDGLNKLTKADRKYFSALMLDRIIDFRAQHEKEREPDQLPGEMIGRVVEIPILDASTRIWHESRDEFVRNMKKIDPAYYMIRTNVELATIFNVEIRHFISELILAGGKPVLFHCAAGKDRTGFAAAILLRILGVPYEVVVQDYLLTNQYFLAAHQRNLTFLRLMKGTEFAESVKGFMEARPEYIGAAMDCIDREYGSFEDYVYKALDLSLDDTQRLRELYLD